MNSETVIAEWRANSREIMRVRLDQYQGSDIIDIRKWFPGTDGVLRPGRGGLCVSTRHLPALAEALRQALESAKAQGLITEPEGGGE